MGKLSGTDHSQANIDFTRASVVEDPKCSIVAIIRLKLSFSD